LANLEQYLLYYRDRIIERDYNNISWREVAKLKVLKHIVGIIFILCLPVLLVSLSLAWGFNSFWLYNYGFQEYSVSQTTGLTQDELTIAGKGLIKYFNSSEEYVHITLIRDGHPFELFTPEEQSHFKDVKQLVWLDYRVLLISLILVLSYALAAIFLQKGKYRSALAWNVIWGSLLTIVLIVIVGVASILDFDSLFLKFHYLAFTNQYWSAAGYMLLLFPGGFWFDAALFCIGFVTLLAIILGVAAGIYLKDFRKSRKISERPAIE